MNEEECSRVSFHMVGILVKDGDFSMKIFLLLILFILPYCHIAILP